MVNKQETQTQTAPAPEELDAGESAFFHHLGSVTAEAIRIQFEHGLAIVFKRGNSIIRKYPNGTEEILSTSAPRIPHQFPAGTVFIEK